jgi:hypothetical protein
MSNSDDAEAAVDTPLEDFKKELSSLGFVWVKEIGHVHYHIFEHTRTRRVMPIPVERGMVLARYVANARKIAEEEDRRR